MTWRMRVGLVVGIAVAALSAPAQDGGDVSVERMKKDLFFLASPQCEGRGPGTKGIDVAADYIAKQFAAAGVRPGGPKDDYFQPFDIKGTPELDAPNSLSFRGPQGQVIAFGPDDFGVMGVSGAGKISAPLVFAGHGIRSKQAGFDDYAGLDVAGKIVVLLRHTPRWSHRALPFGGNENEKGRLADLSVKVSVAASLKAAGVIVVNDSVEVAAGDQVPPFSYLAQATSSPIPCVHVKRSALEPLFRSTFLASLEDVEKATDRDLKPRGAVLDGWSASIETSVRRTKIACRNVIGVIEGSGPLAKQIVVVGAHYDHLGYGGSGSLAPGVTAIHAGADDNASGTTAIIELSRRFAARKDRLGRTLVFMAFSAEERGLFGSKHYCDNALFPLEQTAAMVNLDMVGRLRAEEKTKKDKLLVEGAGTSKEFEPLLDKLNTGGFTFIKKGGGFGPSDHASFYAKKIPVLFFWTGNHEDYHKPSDTAERINLAGMRKVVDYIETLVDNLAGEPARPQYVEVQSPARPGGPSGPRLGIIPNYESDKEGVVVGGVSPGGAASKAGLKAGDRIVEIASRKVSNIETYMVIMGEQRVGEAIDIAVLRDEKKLVLKVVPQ